MPTSEIKEYWKRIELWLSKHMPDGLDRLRPGASEQEIAALEAHLNITLPADFRASAAIHDGNVKSNILLNDGRDNFTLLPLESIKEETKPGKNPPVLYFPNGDYTYLNTGSGELRYISHDGGWSKLKDFKTLLKMNAENLESGRFHIDKYGSIGPIYIDDGWQMVAELPAFSGRLNDPMTHRTPEYKVLRAFFKEKGKSFHVDVNEHFERSYSQNHNGQNSDELLFYDGRERLMFLTSQGMMEEYETLPGVRGMVLPMFKNPESGNKIFIEVHTDGYNTSVLHKKYASPERLEQMSIDLLDLLLITRRFHLKK